MNQSTASSNDILVDQRDGIGRVTFNRPEARNAFTFAMYERLAAICEEANGDRSLKVLVLQGAGDKAFAAGTDINQFRAFTTPQHALDYEGRIDRVLGKLETCRVPTIAAITGACTGGGAGIAACCDMRIGTKTTKFGFPIARTLGNCLSMSNISRLTALIGPARVKDLIFTARLVGADEAAGVGLLSEVVDDIPALQKRADELATLIAGNAPLTLNATKQALARLQRRLSREEGEDLILMCVRLRPVVADDDLIARIEIALGDLGEIAVVKAGHDIHRNRHATTEHPDFRLGLCGKCCRRGRGSSGRRRYRLRFCR